MIINKYLIGEYLKLLFAFIVLLFIYYWIIRSYLSHKYVFTKPIIKKKNYYKRKCDNVTNK